MNQLDIYIVLPPLVLGQFLCISRWTISSRRYHPPIASSQCFGTDIIYEILYYNRIYSGFLQYAFIKLWFTLSGTFWLSWLFRQFSFDSYYFKPKTFKLQNIFGFPIVLLWRSSCIPKHNKFDLIWFIVLNATFSNISAISWQPVLVVEEAEYPKRTTDHGQATGNLYHLRLRVECTLFCHLQSQARTHAVFAIGLYELLGNPTT